MSPLYEVPGVRLFFELAISPAIESALLVGIYAICRSVGGAKSDSTMISVICFILISAAFGFLAHGGLVGDVGVGIVLSTAFALFAVQLVWMRARYDWTVTLFGLFLSHFSFNLTPYLWL